MTYSQKYTDLKTEPYPMGKLNQQFKIFPQRKYQSQITLHHEAINKQEKYNSDINISEDRKQENL